MELKKGFKRTEGGIIPTDWNDFTIGDLIFFQGGSQPDKNTFISSEKPGYIRLIQIRDYKTDKYKTYIPFGLARRFCEIDDIMIGRYGPPIFQILKGIKGAYNVALIKAIPQYPLDKIYAYYFLKQEKLFSFVEKLSQRSSGQTGVDLRELKNYPLPLPPTKAEQTAIANALSDADALIQSLTRLIAKKRQIKQGAMQTMLNPYENGRLKEGWAVKKLGEIGEIVTGSTPSTQVKEYWNGEIPWITPTDITNEKNIFVSEREISATGLKATRKLPANTLLVTCIASIGKNAILRKTGACNQQINAIIPDKSMNVDFLYYLMENNKQHLLSNAGITATLILSKKEFSEMPFAIPLLDEQIRIATILSEMDAEIAALETKLAKYRQIKQGMMQNLLTGRIRLI
jgi:type I restriction enzyme S subunit